MESGLTAVELAGFTGETVAYYGDFVVEAIEQAEDLFELATGLSVLPVEGLSLRVARRGVLSMAEALYEGQQYRAMRFSPFRSQTIGSYSYTLAEQSVLAGVPTKVAWFDMAVRALAVSLPVSVTSVRVFDRPGDLAVDTTGARYLIGPADEHRMSGYGEGTVHP